ncbi:hypothetical protein N7536_009019, partial [Penicillium majusculum]
RYIRFDIDKLYNTTITVSGKFKGGFSKAFLIRKENRSEVIAKILYYITSPPTLTIASEVGALEYIFYYFKFRIEAQLSAIYFPTYRGLYLRTDIEQLNKPLNNELDLSFYIRPSYNRGYNPNLSLDFDKGPYESPTVFNFNPQGFYYKARNTTNIKERPLVFLKPPQNYDYKKGIFKVKQRDDFDTLDKDSKILIIRE